MWLEAKANFWTSALGVMSQAWQIWTTAENCDFDFCSNDFLEWIAWHNRETGELPRIVGPGGWPTIDAAIVADHSTCFSGWIDLLSFIYDVYDYRQSIGYEPMILPSIYLPDTSSCPWYMQNYINGLRDFVTRSILFQVKVAGMETYLENIQAYVDEACQ